MANTCKRFSKLAKIHNQRKWKNLNYPAFESIPFSPQLEMVMRFPRIEDEKSKARFILYLSSLYKWKRFDMAVVKRLGEVVAKAIAAGGPLLYNAIVCADFFKNCAPDLFAQSEQRLLNDQQIMQLFALIQAEFPVLRYYLLQEDWHKLKVIIVFLEDYRGSVYKVLDILYDWSQIIVDYHRSEIGNFSNIEVVDMEENMGAEMAGVINDSTNSDDSFHSRWDLSSDSKPCSISSSSDSSLDSESSLSGSSSSSSSDSDSDSD